MTPAPAERVKAAAPKGLATRRKLLDCAIRAIADTGYAHTTTQILDRSRVSRGSLLYPFGARHDMMVAVAHAALESMIDSIGRGVARGGSVLDGLLRAVLRAAGAARRRERKTNAAALHRWETREEIADLAMVLASPIAASVSGAILPIEDPWKADENSR